MELELPETVVSTAGFEGSLAHTLFGFFSWHSSYNAHPNFAREGVCPGCWLVFEET